MHQGLVVQSGRPALGALSTMAPDAPKFRGLHCAGRALLETFPVPAPPSPLVPLSNERLRIPNALVGDRPTPPAEIPACCAALGHRVIDALPLDV